MWRRCERPPIAAWVTLVLGVLTLFAVEAPPHLMGGELTVVIVGAVFVVVGTICATVRGG